MFRAHFVSMHWFNFARNLQFSFNKAYNGMQYNGMQYKYKQTLLPNFMSKSWTASMSSLIYLFIYLFYMLLFRIAKIDLGTISNGS